MEIPLEKHSGLWETGKPWGIRLYAQDGTLGTELIIPSKKSARTASSA